MNIVLLILLFIQGLFAKPLDRFILFYPFILLVSIWSSVHELVYNIEQSRRVYVHVVFDCQSSTLVGMYPALQQSKRCLTYMYVEHNNQH